MAITARAARKITMQSEATPEVVGPGSYLSVDRDAPVHGFAPFSSTVQPSMPGQIAIKSSNPGPGDYVVASAPQGRQEGVGAGANSAFVSRSTREFEKGEDVPSKAPKKANPGPGSYEVRKSEDWRHDRRWASSAPPAGTRRAERWSHSKMHPPSIPVHAQSYGYEETSVGDLVMQPPPDGGFSGISGRRSVGPGDYEASKAVHLTKPALAKAHFGNSRVQRDVFGKAAGTPGPGNYFGEEEGQRRRIKANANFSSRVPLPHQTELDTEKVLPGPGSYQPDTGMRAKAVPAQMQNFGTTQKRLASDAILPSERAYQAQPGPGAYERIGDFEGSQAKDPASITSAFNSSSQRFKPLLKGREPGPGAYDELDQNTFVVAMQRKPHGRNGVFGSTTRRFHTLKKDAVPGAGSYNPVPSGDNAEKDDMGGSVFVSAVDRFPKQPAPTSTKAKKAPQIPAPWQYSIKSENSWDLHPGASRKPDMTFGTTSERFPPKEVSGEAMKQVPGPGSYHPKRTEDNLRLVSMSECFGSKEARFQKQQRGTFSGKPTPGPGAYESSVSEADPLVKRSFNITIG